MIFCSCEHNSKGLDISKQFFSFCIGQFYSVLLTLPMNQYNFSRFDKFRPKISLCSSLMLNITTKSGSLSDIKPSVIVKSDIMPSVTVISAIKSSVIMTSVVEPKRSLS